VPQNRIDAVARHNPATLAKRRQRVLDRVRAIGDFRLPDDTRGTLEGMSQP